MWAYQTGAYTHDLVGLNQQVTTLDPADAGLISKNIFNVYVAIFNFQSLKYFLRVLFQFNLLFVSRLVHLFSEFDILLNNDIVEIKNGLKAFDWYFPTLPIFDLEHSEASQFYIETLNLLYYLE